MRANMSVGISEWGSFANRARLLVVVALLISLADPRGVAARQEGASASDQPSGISLAEFRRLVSDHQRAASTPGKKNQPLPSVDLREGDSAFREILMFQSRIAAKRQSQDRLAGWNAAIKSRIEAQSISALDVEILGHAENQIASELAQLESDLKSVVDRANGIAGRDRSLPLPAMVEFVDPSSPDAEGPNVMEKNVLVAGRDLLVKLFQSYSIGGISVSELLWHEQRATAAETNYRLWTARAGFDAAAILPAP